MARLQEEIICSVCLDIYDTPVSLNCGHSFCRACIQKVRSAAHERFRCPLCGAWADSAMEPQPNFQLHSIVQKLLNISAGQEKEEHEVECKEKEESSDEDDEVILCDYCLQEPQPAVKTCLSCEASLCQAHMSKHSVKSPLKDHVLVEPCGAQVLAERRCPQHGKLLECYCETDSACICVVCCVTSSHRNHAIVSLEEAFGKLQKVLPGTLQTVKAHKAALDKNIANLIKQEEEVKTVESLQRNQLESLFEEMCVQLNHRKREVLNILSHSMEQQISEIQAKMQERKEESDVATHDIWELEALRDQKDPLLFFKASAVILARKHVPVPEEDGIELPVPPIMLDEVTTQTTLRLFQQFLSDMESLFKAPPIHEHLTCKTSKLVYPERLPHHQFTHINLSHSSGAIQPVLSDQIFSQGCHFWDVDTNNETYWKLGTVHPNFACFLEKTCNNVSVLVGLTCIKKQELQTNLRVVRVELDCGRNTVSFYNVPLGQPDEPVKLIDRISIPSSYPARAAFSVRSGQLVLL